MDTVGHMTGHMTPQQAARRAGVGRTTIMRALDAHELRGVKNNAGRWQITPDALEDWLSMRPVRSHDQKRPRLTPDSNSGQELAAAKIEIASLTAQKEGLEARLADTQAERDRLADALDKALESRRGILARIFGRS